MYGANRKRVDAFIRDARVAAGRSQSAEARTGLQAARRLLALEKDPVWVGERSRAIQSVENLLRSPARAVARQAGPSAGALSRGQDTTPAAAVLQQRVARVEQMIQARNLKDAARDLIVLRARADALGGGKAVRRLRNRISDLEGRVRRLQRTEGAPSWTSARGVATEHSGENLVSSHSLATPRQTRAPAAAPGGQKPTPPTPEAVLRQRAAHVEQMIQAGSLKDAARGLSILRAKTDALGGGKAAQKLRNRAADLERRLAKRARSEEPAPRTPSARATTKPGTRKTTQGTRASASAKVEQVTCDLCKRRRPPDQIIKKAGKRQICVPCATGQTCPSCHRSKSPDFELCIRCSGGAGQIKLVLAGGFETNRRRH